MKNKIIAKMNASKTSEVVKGGKSFLEILSFMKRYSEFEKRSKKSNPLVG